MRIVSKIKEIMKTLVVGKVRMEAVISIVTARTILNAGVGTESCILTHVVTNSQGWIAFRQDT
jgi:hypothetical protein